MAYLWKNVNIIRSEEGQRILLPARVSVFLGVVKTDRELKPIRPQFQITGTIRYMQEDGSYSSLAFDLPDNEIKRHFPSTLPYFKWNRVYPDELMGETLLDFQDALDSIKHWVPVYVGVH